MDEFVFQLVIFAIWAIWSLLRRVVRRSKQGPVAGEASDLPDAASPQRPPAPETDAPPVPAATAQPAAAPAPGERGVWAELGAALDAVAERCDALLAAAHNAGYTTAHAAWKPVRAAIAAWNKELEAARVAGRRVKGGRGRIEANLADARRFLDTAEAILNQRAASRAKAIDAVDALLVQAAAYVHAPETGILRPKQLHPLVITEPGPAQDNAVLVPAGDLDRPVMWSLAVARYVLAAVQALPPSRWQQLGKRFGDAWRAPDSVARDTYALVVRVMAARDKHTEIALGRTDMEDRMAALAVQFALHLWYPVLVADMVTAWLLGPLHWIAVRNAASEQRETPAPWAVRALVTARVCGHWGTSEQERKLATWMPDAKQVPCAAQGTVGQLPLSWFQSELEAMARRGAVALPPLDAQAVDGPVARLHAHGVRLVQSGESRLAFTEAKDVVEGRSSAPPPPSRRSGGRTSAGREGGAAALRDPRAWQTAVMLTALAGRKRPSPYRRYPM